MVLFNLQTHFNDPWLLVAGFEGFYKFLPPYVQMKGHDEALVQQIGSLVENILRTYPDDGKLRAWGSRLLELMP